MNIKRKQHQQVLTHWCSFIQKFFSFWFLFCLKDFTLCSPFCSAHYKTRLSKLQHLHLGMDLSFFSFLYFQDSVSHYKADETFHGTKYVLCHTNISCCITIFSFALFTRYRVLSSNNQYVAADSTLHLWLWRNYYQNP